MTPSTSTDDRRPIPQRDHRPWQIAAAKLSAAGVSANAISIGGMLAALLAASCVAVTPYVDHSFTFRGAFLAAALLIPLRLIANMLDGMVAVLSNTASPVGELFNEIPDRLSDATILIALGYAAGGTPWLGWLAALSAIITAYIRATGKNAGAMHCFAGPMAKPQRMWIVFAVCLLSAAWPRATEFYAPTVALAVITLGSTLTCIRRLWLITGELTQPAPPNSDT